MTSSVRAGRPPHGPGGSVPAAAQASGVRTGPGPVR